MKATALIVDDDSEVRELLAMHCRRLGLDSVQAANGAEALQRLRSSRIDLLLLDIHMPVMNGVELLDEMAKYSDLCGVMVIVISALNDTENISRCLERGVVDYLVKPLDIRLFSARINNCLARLEGERNASRIREDSLREEISKQMVGSICHHFNQPLTISRGNCEMRNRLMTVIQDLFSRLEWNKDHQASGELSAFMEEFWSHTPYPTSCDFMNALTECDIAVEASLERIAGVVTRVHELVRPGSKTYAGTSEIFDFIGSCRETILVAEGDDSLLNVYVNHLKKAGFVVITARDGEEMERHLHFSSPHLIVMNLALRGMEGLSPRLFARQTREMMVPIFCYASTHEGLSPSLLSWGRARSEAFFGEGGESEADTVVKAVQDYFLSHREEINAEVLSRAIDARRKAEKELLQIEEKLHHAEKMQAVGELAGGIAHDFNNQLAGVTGYAELLRISFADEDVRREYAEAIMAASENAAALTRQLLAFSRTGTKANEPVSIHKVLQEVVFLLGHTLDKRIEVKTSFAAEEDSITGDKGQIHNAMLNLCINAGDAMPGGGVLELSTEKCSYGESYCRQLPFTLAPGDYIKVAVKDTGVGIDEETLKHIFEPFFTTKREGKGTGLGLAAVFGTVKSHSGKVDVLTVPGEGSTFIVSLPLGDGSCVTTQAVKQSAVHGRGRILVVDDEPLVRNLACDALKTFGYDTVSCKDGVEAVDYYVIHWQSIDLVLMDVMMPRMNAGEAFRAMKRQNPDVKVILFSGHQGAVEVDCLQREGVLEFLKKPVSMVDLSLAVGRALKA